MNREERENQDESRRSDGCAEDGQFTMSWKNAGTVPKLIDIEEELNAECQLS